MKILIIILGILLLIYALYFFVFAVYGLLKKRKPFPETDANLHFALLIPARNEETVIGDLLKSIRALDYPQDHFDTYVIVNHCSDRTEEIAQSFGANVLPCTVPTKTKGDVLRFAFDALSSHAKIDAYVIVDADNTVSASFLSEINKALAAGYPAAQCVRTGRNSDKSVVAGCYEIYYRFQNAFFNHPRAVAGLPASINGSGWAVLKDLIDREGFETVTITEDMEFTILCGLSRHDIAFIDTAQSSDQFVSDWKVSWKQRIRWTYGVLQCIRQYQRRLIKAALHGSFVCFDLSMINIMIPVTAFGLLLMPFGYLGMHGLLSFPVYLLVACSVFYITGCIAGLLSVILTHGDLGSVWKGILGYPLFLLTWVPLFLSCFFRREIAWSPIRASHYTKKDE